MTKLPVSALTSKSAATRTAVAAALLSAFAPAQTQNAVANGDTRTINLFHTHSMESISATFRVNGSYDYAALERLNYFLRDWRNNDAIKMDPRLFDVVWETYRESGSREPVQIVSAYRSPATNAMLRRRSSGVAEYSQHMLGKAMDMHYSDVPMARVREIAMRLQRGGVGYYPTSGSPFVHLDVGSVRAWPRMSYEQLARIFPDGKTVHVAANGQPLGRYDEARALVQSRNGVSVPTSSQVQSKGFFASLFGGGEDEPGAAGAPARGTARTRLAANTSRGERTAPAPQTTAIAQASTPSEDTPASYFMAEASRRTGGAELAPATALRGRATRPAPAETAPVLVAKVETRAEPKPTPVFEPQARPPAPEEYQIRLGAAPTGRTLPLPPRRPAEFASPTLVAANVPVPPTRPSDLARAPVEETPVRLARADLPSVITTGAKSTVVASAASVGALGFAPAAPSLTDPAPKPQATRARTAAAPTASVIAQPIGLRAAILAPRRPAAVASRLDRSNFRQLTAPEPIARMESASLAPAAPALRAAARGGLRDAIFAEPANVVTRFEPMSASLPAPVFAGAAVGRLVTASVRALN